jgi:hypothetical protein
MTATCPNSSPAISAGSAFPTQTPVITPLQTYNNGGTTQCAAATQVTIYLRIEQIYEIAGMPKMSVIDSVTNAQQAVNLPVSDWIKTKTAGNCPPGAVTMADGSCAFQ